MDTSTGFSPDLDDLGHVSGGGGSGGHEQEQDGAGPNDDKGPAGKKRRNRKPVTCAQCRKRKLKCDRGSPCGACRDRNEGHLCEWEGAIRLPQSNYTRDQEAVELRSQLDRLEGLLGVLAGTSYADGDLAVITGLAVQSAVGARPQDLDVERTSAAEALGLLAGTSNAGGGAAAGAGAAHLLGPVAGSSQTIDQILSILPHRIELDMLVTQFLSEDTPTLPVVHVPSFRERYHSFDRTSARTEPFFVAFLFAVSGWSTYFKTTDPRSPRSGAAVKEGTAKTYLNAAMEALHVGGFMETPSMDSLRTLLVLHHYYTRQDSASAAYILNSALEVAQNRDPAASPFFGFIECEERRRLWTLVSTFDWIENHGRTYKCHPAQSDTLPPSNVRDEDVTDTGIITRPLSTPTPILHLLLKAQIAAFARTITDRIYSVQFPPSWAMLLELNAEFSRLDNGIPQCLAYEWVGGSVKPFEDETKPLDSAKILVHLLLRMQCIRLHRPFLTRGFADPRFSFAREKVTWAARYTLAIHKGLGDDYRAARSWPLVFHALNAILILAIDLYLEPHGGKYSDVHRADIAASQKLLESRAAKSKVVKETLRVVNVLLRRSHGGGADKKRSHDDFMNGSSGGGTNGGGGGYGGVGGVSSPPSESPANLSYILSGQPNTSFLTNHASSSSSSPHQHLDTILRPFEANSPFSRPLPVPMSVDPPTLAASPLGAGPDHEWTNLWTVLSRHRGFYAIPDAAEWEEMSYR
ncbi:hypothetical protein RQP46_011199 [Phenoliferia psychrophenolica]